MFFLCLSVFGIQNYRYFTPFGDYPKVTYIFIFSFLSRFRNSYVLPILLIVMAKMFRFLTAVLAGTFVYVLISLSFGRDGLWADGQLREQRQILSDRTEEIKKINNGLELEYTALKKDPDVIAAFARKLGYVRNGEKIVKINGLVADEQFYFETGKPLRYEELFSCLNGSAKLPASSCSLLSMLICASKISSRNFLISVIYGVEECLVSLVLQKSQNKKEPYDLSKK